MLGVIGFFAGAALGLWLINRYIPPMSTTKKVTHLTMKLKAGRLAEGWEVTSFYKGPLDGHQEYMPRGADEVVEVETGATYRRQGDRMVYTGQEVPHGQR